MGLGLGTGVRRTMPVVVAGHSELEPVKLSEDEVQDLIAFLGSLAGIVVEESRLKWLFAEVMSAPCGVT